MKLTRWICVTVLILGAAGCAGGSSGAKSPGGSSGSAGSAPSSSSSAPPTSSSSSPAQLQRVAEIHSEGGFAGNQLRLQPAAIVVYSDGTVILDAVKTYTLDPSALSTLVSTVRKDLDGLPPTVNPAHGHPIPDIPTTVIGVRKADGSYQTVRAAALPQLREEGGYPAPLYDAYSKLTALTATAGTPFTGPTVRYLLQCPVPAQSQPHPWPAELPQPENTDAMNCAETHVTGGAVAGVVRADCLAYKPGDLQTQAAVPYQSTKGIRTCQWRYALPDETS